MSEMTFKLLCTNHKKSLNSKADTKLSKKFWEVKDINRSAKYNMKETSSTRSL